ncbi:cadherin EGF LAG seven-pass G-type receptor 2-like [Homarus americanus]|uniref:cadherin EGF LAG seven-pass G-type receptor 2-like n=1 Tax=Homarus americanus TaxID=6706 RepID=UPI001C48A148|nr:cadherin EGF LAG seven-pass G-type receptor 2-like [Homarus americanus]
MTTDLHIPYIHLMMKDVNDVGNNYELIDGPFGFGYGIDINAEKQQCQSMTTTTDDGDCAYDPIKCNNGVSFSIWERIIATLDEFFGSHKMEDFPKKYIISTGGDMMGHPGIALYHHAFLLINDRIVAYSTEGISVTALPPLDPPELMIGCHKTSTDTTYRHYHTTQLDEFAWWNRRLVDEDVIYFLGGYEGESENIDPDEFATMLNRTHLNDPVQLAVAASVLEEMTRATSDDSFNASTATDEERKAKIESFNITLESVKKMTDPKFVPRCILEKDLERSMTIIKVINNLMDESKKEDWLLYEEEHGKDVFLLCQYMRGYLHAVYQGLLCNNTQSGHTVELSQMCIKVVKRTIDIGYSTKDRFTIPGCSGLGKVLVPVNLFSDPRCNHRTANFRCTAYKGIHTMQASPIRLNTGAFNTKVDNILDSLITELDVNTDQILLPNGDLDPKSPRCDPDPAKLTTHPIIVTHRHFDPQVQFRKPLFHAGEVRTTIGTRICVWWNPALGQHGAWDRYGCRVWEAKPEYTKCACQHLGKYVIIAEKLEPMEVPEEPMWLTIVRYILYGVSALCLILYIIVVGISGDLKEKFHLMGMTLAAMLLAASVFMVLSDLHGVREGRHTCAFFGIAIHFLYLCASIWVGAIGHATFKCITSGIVGGSLRPYLYLCVGLTLISVGCVLTFLLKHMGNDPRCFISWDNEPEYLFFCPLGAACCVGLFCAIVIFFNLRTAALRNNPTMTDYRTFSLGASFFTIYFSTTWVLGFLTYFRLDLDFSFYTFFQILNGLMGVVLMCCIGVGSSKFRMVFAGQAKKRREMFLNYTNKKGGDDENDDTKKLGSPADQTPPTRPVTPSFVAGRPVSGGSMFSD